MRSLLQRQSMEIPANRKRASLTPETFEGKNRTPPETVNLWHRNVLVEALGGDVRRKFDSGKVPRGHEEDWLAQAVHEHLDKRHDVFSANSFVIHPLRFPGGSIGKLAVNGTINALAISGNRARTFAASLVLEEGFPNEALGAEVRAIDESLRRAKVLMANLEIKLTSRGQENDLHIVTVATGTPFPSLCLDAKYVKPGDKVLVSGPIGDHGISILLAHADCALRASLRSDCRSVLSTVESLVSVCGRGVRWMQVPRRGGVAQALNALARARGLAVEISEDDIPIRNEVRGACDLLGMNPLHLSNEGQFLMIVEQSCAEIALNTLQGIEGGESAAIIGRICEHPAYMVVLHSRSHAPCTLDPARPVAPRIC